MNIDEARKLQHEWGDKPCDHPDVKAESDSKGDDWRCTQCGGLVDFDDWQGSRYQPLSTRAKENTPCGQTEPGCEPLPIGY